MVCLSLSSSTFLVIVAVLSLVVLSHSFLLSTEVLLSGPIDLIQMDYVMQAIHSIYMKFTF